MSVSSHPVDLVRGTTRFLAPLEGLRAWAALGVVITHVAFQTGHSTGISGRLWGRFDMAVAVFFALSGFLLWRPYAGAAHHRWRPPLPGQYFRSRLVRIFPAYIVSVIVILALLPNARGANLTVWLANLTMTQIYVALTLTPGLTQMWSLAVEISFYLVLPICGWLAKNILPSRRAATIIILSIASLGWGYLPIHTPDGVNPLNWAPAYASWFGMGMLLAEWIFDPPLWIRRLVNTPQVFYVIAMSAYLIAASPLAGPEGLTASSVNQFIVRTSMGALLAFSMLAPIVLDDPGIDHPWLTHRMLRILGRWSYGIFIWHLAALDMVFPVMGYFPFNGHMPIVLGLTALFSIALAAVSYALVEYPCQQWLRSWEKRHHHNTRNQCPNVSMVHQLEQVASKSATHSYTG